MTSSTSPVPGPASGVRDGLRVLVVDDEPPALDELCWLLGRDDRVAQVTGSGSATEALRLLREDRFDAVFVDIQMPGLTGLELAQVLANFKSPPPVVFVTAHEEHAVEAFELDAVDYVLKPVREERLAEAVRRVLPAPGVVATEEAEGDQVLVERGGVTRFLDRALVTHVEAHGDYARLHLAYDAWLLRTPLATLEEQWADAGFVRVHRSYLVAVAHVEEIRADAGRWTVVVTGGIEVPVSRRHAREARLRITGMRVG